MRATLFHPAGDVRVERVPDSRTEQPGFAAVNKREATKAMIEL